MSDKPTPIWTTTTVERGCLTVNLDPWIGEDWVQAANDVAHRFGSEARGQTWGHVRFNLDGTALQVLGIDETTDVPTLRAYVSDVIDAAEREVARMRAERDRAAAEGRAAEDAQRSKDQDLTQRFRDLG